MIKLKKAFGIILVVVVALTAVGATVAFAQPAFQDDDSAGEAGTVEAGLLRRIFDPEAAQAALAEALGLTVDELVAAREAGQTIPEIAADQGVAMEEVEAAMLAYKAEAVQQALDDGLITDAQAEWLLNHNLRRLRRGAGILRQVRNIFDPAAMKTAVADALGIDVSELEAAREAGKTVPELADELGVPMEEVKAAGQSAWAEMVEQAVAEGQITAEQGDWLQNHAGQLLRALRNHRSRVND